MCPKKLSVPALLSMIVAASTAAPAQPPATGGEIQVNTTTTSYQVNPVVAADGAGGFLVVWHSFGQDGSDDSVQARRFDAAGTAVGVEFQVNTTVDYDQGFPSVAAIAGLGFVVVWESFGPEGDADSVQARWFDAEGAAIGDELQVNTFTTSDQEDPTVASDAFGNFVVAWESYGQDGSVDSVHAQHFVALVFADGFESGDTLAWSTSSP